MGGSLRRLLVLATLLAGCQETISLEPPPLTAEGSVLWVGTRGPGTVEIYPANPVTFPDLTVIDGREIYVIGQSCPLEVLAPDVPAGEVVLDTFPKLGAILPAPVEIFGARFGPAGPTTDWAPLDQLPEAAARALALLPVPHFNYCRVAAPAATFSLESVAIPDLVATLFPNAVIDLGSELLIGSNISYDSFDFTGDSTTAYSLSRIRQGRLVGDPVTTTDPESIFMTGDGHADDFYLFGRNGLARGSVVGDDVQVRTVTASISFPQLYEAELAASNRGEPPEHFLVTSGWYLEGGARTGRELRTFRHFDGQSWDTIERFDVTAVSPGANLSISRLGVGEAFAIGLDGNDYSVFWWRNGELTRFVTDAYLRNNGALTRARRIPGLGIVVGTTRGALYGFDNGEWTVLREPYGGLVFDLIAAPGGLIGVRNNVSLDLAKSALTPFTLATGVCSDQPLTAQPIRKVKLLGDGRSVAVDYNTVAGTIRYALISPIDISNPCVQSL